MSDEQAKFDEWAIVDLFGHQRIAGRVSEQAVGGCSFVRVDVPASDRRPGFTRLFGAGAIYAITIIDQETAELAARACLVQPMEPWSIREAAKALPPATESRQPSDDEDLEGEDFEP